MKVIPYSIFGWLACAKERTWHTHTDTTQTATIYDKLPWPQLQKTPVQRFQLPCLAWKWNTATRPWPRMMWSLQCVQLRQGMVHPGVPCHLNLCDTFLTVVIHDMAVSESIGSFEVWCPNLICFSVGFLCKGLDRRHINHYTMEAFYALYKMWCEGQEIEEKEVASSRRFRDIYSQQWASTLQMRELSQHARCLLYFALVFLSLSVSLRSYLTKNTLNS